jgi:C1A family cysteine protease
MKINIFFGLVSMVMTVNGRILDLFNQWAQNHNIDLSEPRIFERILNNWLDNHEYIENVNAKNLTYKLGHNAYSGYSSDEFAELMGFNRERTAHLRGSSLQNLELTAPTSIDWRSKGMVNPVRDQGQCGSCWAFSTIQSVESAVAIKTGKLNQLSEQELVDCDNLSNGGRDHGCNGGLMDYAFSWIGKRNGVCSQASYPYVSGSTKTEGTCKMDSCTNVANTDVLKYVDIATKSDTAMMNALALQPVSVAIQANQRDFQLYSSGVFTGSCGTSLDHGVGLVGYGNLNGLDHYILRNSWGTSWGVSGYMYLGRGVNPNTGSPYNSGSGQCGVLLEGSYPVV